MTVGNFTELYGIGGDLSSVGFDSITGADSQIVYALDGDDSLKSNFGITTILVGGTGRNRYNVTVNSTAIIIENDNDSDNILWTTISSSGISLEKETSFVSVIDNRHLYLGDTATNQYAILIDWQEPANRIESFDLTEGRISYEEFVSRYQNSNNYRGNLTWQELAATGEIDLERLGLSPDTIERDLRTIDRRSKQLEDGTFFSAEEEFVYGENRDDYLRGDIGTGALFSYGGKDTLEGYDGNDIYFVDVDKSNGSQIRDTKGLDYLIIAESENLQDLADGLFFDPYSDLRSSDIYNDYSIELSFPTPEKIGIERIDNHLIIDLNRDGVAEIENDVTIFDYFDGSGRATRRAIERINNISSNDLVSFFANSAREKLKDEDFGENTIYRFYDRHSGVHFYTADRNERDYVYDRLNNYTYEGASYQGIDSSSQTESLAVHRFYNRDSGSHFYTIDENEKNVVEQELDNYNYEGEAFFAHHTEVEGSIPIYRFYNSITGAHFYTPSAVERDSIIDDLPNFESEGIAYYAFSIDFNEI